MSDAAPKKSRAILRIGLAIMLSGGITSCDEPKKKTVQTSVINVTLPAPPPPPPPPPPPQNEPPPPEEQKMIEAEPVIDEEPPPEAKAPDEPPSDLTTNLKGDGPNRFGLAQGDGRGGGGTIGGGGNGGPGSKWGRYNSGLARSIESALKAHPATRNARFSLGRTALWLDASGRITRVKLLDSTGDTTLDETISNQILPGILYQPQPEGMPSPVNIRINARKP